MSLAPPCAIGARGEGLRVQFNGRPTAHQEIWNAAELPDITFRWCLWRHRIGRRARTLNVASAVPGAFPSNVGGGQLTIQWSTAPESSRSVRVP